MNVLKIAKEDTNKVKNLNALGMWLWASTRYEEAKKYANDALVLAEKLHFKNGKATAYYYIGLIYNHQANLPEALKNYLAALKIYEKIRDKRGIATSYIGIGVIYWHHGNYTEALSNHLAALKIYEEIGDKPGIADSYYRIGTINRNQGNYAEAFKKFLSYLKIMEETNHRPGVANAYYNIGLTYWQLGNYPEALKNHLTSLKIREEIGDKRGVAGSQNEIGIIYGKLGNYLEALKNCLAALKFNEEIGDKYACYRSYDNIGEIYRYQCNYPKALKNYLAALKNVEEIGDKMGITDSYNLIGKVYIELGKNSEAKKYLTNSLSLAKEIGLKENIRDAYDALSKLDSAMGNYQQALVHYKLYTDYKDSLFNETSNSQIDQMKEQYESEKKDKQIELLNKEKAIQKLQLKKQRQTKNYFIAGLALFLVLSFFIYRNYNTRQKLKLLTLRNKIASDLHDDVGSTLSSISIFSQMAQQQSKETILMLETIGESSRKMLDAMADIVWTIDPQNDQFGKIILRMKSFAYELLGAKNIDFEFVADDEISKVNLTMEVKKNLYLIFKEATNNMVKYADANKAMFSIKGERNSLTMMIHDDGKGFDMNKSTEGNGLKNMKKRAIEIGAQLMIDSFPGKGTTIQLSVAV